MLESICGQFSKAKATQADKGVFEGVTHEQTVIGFEEQRK